MSFVTESRRMTADELRAAGQVRCCECLNYKRIESDGPLRCRLAWNPAMQGDRWRRCKSFDRMTTGGQHESARHLRRNPGT